MKTEIRLSDTSKSFKALNPDLFGPSGSPQDQAGMTAAPVLAQKGPPIPKKRSYAEKAMESYLQVQKQKGEIADYAFEAITLKVGEPCCRYTPDFLVILNDGRIRLVECKGKKIIWEDGLIKAKAAKLLYPAFEIELWHISKDTFERRF